ncbi:hypothetical protein N7G274_001053 [Stereocaulon virgatum]|uniref:Uncharacterized protein n=1 Tax=Stereocaulon virgatum TaxID=373712 RepID=A0ABR4ANK7_9LECA
MESKTKEVLLAPIEHPDQQILEDVAEAKAAVNLAVDRHRQNKASRRDSTYPPPIKSVLPKLVMTHTKRERKLAKAKIKAIKAATAAQRARRVTNQSREELKRCREGDISNGMVAAAESKMMEDRVAIRIAEEAFRIAEEQAQRFANRLSTAKARQAAMLQTKDEVQMPHLTKGSESATHSSFPDKESEPVAGAEGFLGVLGAKRELELAQLEEELERKRRKPVEMESEIAESKRNLEMEKVGRGAICES